MTKFVQFTNVVTMEPILVNPEHVRTAQQEAGQNNRVWVKLGMGGEGKDAEVEGDLKAVWVKLAGQSQGAAPTPPPPTPGIQGRT